MQKVDENESNRPQVNHTKVEESTISETVVKDYKNVGDDAIQPLSPHSEEFAS